MIPNTSQPWEPCQGQKMCSMAHIGITSNPAEGAFDSCIQVVDKYIEEDWTCSIGSTGHSHIHSGCGSREGDDDEAEPAEPAEEREGWEKDGVHKSALPLSRDG